MRDLTKNLRTQSSFILKFSGYLFAIVLMDLAAFVMHVGVYIIIVIFGGKAMR